MGAFKISERISYVGVNDRVTQRFEGLWPLRFGVSYNSYVVQGTERVAVIDGVELSRAASQIEEIREILGGRVPDYLVINHMEPDHSGAIRALRAAFPEIVIVGNAQTLAMVKGYYGETENVLQVKDGDVLELGDATLRFTLTPMVHWPETMMTFLEQEHALFSGDAFGCFGALNGAVLDVDMDVERYMPEMLRYYSNIVGKYGQFVQRALAKLEGVEIGMICSTHGPVWTATAARVVALYDTLSRYEPLDNGVTIVYGSMYGNTAEMAEAIAAGLAEAGVRDIEVFNASFAEASDMIAAAFRHRGLVIASPTYSDGIFPPVESFVNALAVRGLRNRDVVVCGSFTWSPQAAKGILARLEGCNLTLAAQPFTVKQHAGAEALSTCREAGRALAAALHE